MVQDFLAASDCPTDPKAALSKPTRPSLHTSSTLSCTHCPRPRTVRKLLGCSAWCNSRLWASQCWWLFIYRFTGSAQCAVDFSNYGAVISEWIDTPSFRSWPVSISRAIYFELHILQWLFDFKYEEYFICLMWVWLLLWVWIHKSKRTQLFPS